jgi:murein DD-endopeptidase MepM/ murein hydrolase activator NlpD
MLYHYDTDSLEGLANEAVLSKTIHAIFSQAEKQGWAQNEKFHILPIENLTDGSPNEDLISFNHVGFRVAVFSVKTKSIHRGVVLTASFQGVNPPQELQSLYRDGSIIDLLDQSTTEFQEYAADIVNRFKNGGSIDNRFVEITAKASSWVAGCETTIAGRFCINARIFDANGIDPKVFYEALSGSQDPTQNDHDTLQAIREQNLAWPIDKSYISRGYKICGCNRQHHGVDFTAPIGTPIYAVSDGTVREAGTFNGWGRTVVIEHELPNGEKFVSLYAHLSRFEKNLRNGSIVKRSQLIAHSGNTGASTGPHLHLEIRTLTEGIHPLSRPTRTHRPVDPLRVLDLFNVFVESSQEAVKTAHSGR